MSVQIADYPDPTRSTPAAAAYGWIDGITISTGRGQAWVDVPVWASVDDYNGNAVPIDTVHVVFGSDGVPSLPEFIATYPEAWAAMRTALYTAISAHPRFAGATQVP